MSRPRCKTRLVLLAAVGMLLLCTGCGSDSGSGPAKTDFEVDEVYERGPVTVHVRLDKTTMSIAETVMLQFEATVQPDYEMKMPEDVGEQADAAFANLERELMSAGLKRTDLIKLTIYVKDMDLVSAGFVLRSAQIYFDNKVNPLITWVGVNTLILPEALVEIEAIAVTGN